ncbi:double-transmembrane region domain protein [Cellulophaga algicola DSM 14237]|uniref:Double-transmembrane region domain protein n=1 Tax=Cellulophaga algicola (strain DSM 14237 / IC166 / ACAM 630) TaxID=688270 RepID=E6X7M2_CELAD|nr:BatA domain-containing protein [Cellulophaga algicola]ADV50732.1 double-transmembrane region domain protein [Cellulophaga algicola DSM 14237]
MHFKHPEILWGLFLLLIPILIHLLQLRRFKKTAFTNVKMLQKVVAESQKSRSLKKWLLLITRIALFTALIIAFAQPYFAKTTAFKSKETIIYIDNSFSMQAKKGNVSLLEIAVQDLLKKAPKNTKLSVFTNTDTYINTTIGAIQNDLLSLNFSQNQLPLNALELKAKSLFSTSSNSIKNLVIISDFQKKNEEFTEISSKEISKYYIQLTPSENKNIAIDSVFYDTTSNELSNLKIQLSASYNLENQPISVYNDTQLIAKTSAAFEHSNTAEVSISLPDNESILGKIQIEDGGLSYDNQFYFSKNKREKIKVLEIYGVQTNYLERIYTSEEFEFQKSSISQLNYSQLESQNTIVLNEIERIPDALMQALQLFNQNGGTLIVIPNNKILVTNYNSLLTKFGVRLNQKINNIQEITSINFDHPLYSYVFDKKIDNFQYPDVLSYYKLEASLPSILSYASNEAFLIGKKGIYVFTSPLSSDFSNFKNSPLIVPTLYNMGVESLAQETLYYTVGKNTSIALPIHIAKDDVLKIANDKNEYIPQQQSLSNKIVLIFNEVPLEDGLFAVKNKEKTFKQLSFNYPRTESKLTYWDLDNFKAINTPTSISDLFETLEKEDSVNELWKWFVILALLFALIEIGIQKYFK